MYDDDDEDDDDRAKFARECYSIAEMRKLVREYLQDEEEGHGLSADEADRLLAAPGADRIIEQGVNIRSYAYYVGDSIKELSD